MLKPANPKARHCYERALEARERGLQASNPVARDVFFGAEARWLKLQKAMTFQSVPVPF